MIEIVVGIFATILGAVFASFFGVIISRVPKHKSIITPPSHCDTCGHELSWYENIPIFSYIFLGGKCKTCKGRISPFSLIYEIIGALSILLLYLQYKLTYEFLFLSVIVLLLLLIAGYDYYTNEILDIFWILLLIVSIGLGVYRVIVLNHNIFDYLIGGGILLLFFLLIKLLSYLIFKKDGLGTGDVIFMAVSGLIIGYKTILITLLVAGVIGSVIELTLIATKKKDRESMIPFLPYLSLGVYVSILYGNTIVNFIFGA